MDMAFNIDRHTARETALGWTTFDERVSPWLIAEILADIGEEAEQRRSAA